MHSLVSNDFSHQAVDQALRAELEGKLISDVPIDDFIQAAFPDTYPRVFESLPLNQYEGYVAAVEQYLRIVQVAKDRSEIYESFAFLVNYVATARFADTKMVLLGGRSVKGVVDRRLGQILYLLKSQYIQVPAIRVPACIVCTQGVRSPGHVSWGDMLVPVYFTATRAEPQPTKGGEGVTTTPKRVGKSSGKSRAATTKSSPTAVQLKPHEVLAGYALEILSASGLRQHAIAILVDNESVSLWYFDRSGVISSTEMNLKTETDQEMFYDVLGILGCASRTDLGYVKRLCPSTGWPSRENAGSLLLWDRGGESRNWDLENLKKLNIGSRGLIGRGTTVYSFGDNGTDPDAPFALKLSWQPTSRPSEADFFVAAQDAGVEGTPRVLAMDRLASLSEGIRSRLPSSSSPWKGQTDRELRALVFDRVCRPLSEFPIMERPLDFLSIFKQLITSMSSSICLSSCGLNHVYVQYTTIYVARRICCTETSVPTTLCGLPAGVAARVSGNLAVRRKTSSLHMSVILSTLILQPSWRVAQWSRSTSKTSPILLRCPSLPSTTFLLIPSSKSNHLSLRPRAVAIFTATTSRASSGHFGGYC